MPLCPQITNTPITVTQTVDFTVSSIVPLIGDTKDGIASNISTTATEATNAFNTANTALTNAATAYSAAIGSLQPSASTIVNASNQITAINGNGITVYSGGSATSGARVVLNSAGLAAYNASNVATFSLTASTGAAVFSGSVTGASITASTMNIGGNAIIDSSGLLTATGATITGTINATAGYFGTVSDGFSISSVGLTGVGSGAITGGTIQTSSNTNRIAMSSSNNALSFYYLGSATAHLLATTGGAGARFHYGATANGATAVYPALDLDSSGLALEGSSTYQIASTSIGNVIYGGHNSTGDITIPFSTLSTGTFSSSSTDQSAGTYLSSSGAMISRRSNQIPIFAHRYSASGTTEMIRLVYNGSDAGGIQTSSAGSPSFRTTSDYRLKSNIQDYTQASSVIKNLRVRSYEMNNNPGKKEIGFIAHEYAETVPDMVNGTKDAIDADGNPEYQSISTTNLIPYIVGALKEALLRIETLEGGNK